MIALGGVSRPIDNDPTCVSRSTLGPYDIKVEGCTHAALCLVYSSSRLPLMSHFSQSAYLDRAPRGAIIIGVNFCLFYPTTYNQLPLDRPPSLCNTCSSVTTRPPPILN
ncbi:hypothetical protein FIBSPDRAFT_8811 [Athelia psychrophila]|uniref:Uncharacterized protein n=1 Tax=Athelia psychrophila TaxID=1759441 RepID=A0A166X5Z6_9AGAM|nr:hypothetical protein FIBSPDRAFT_8811 [Fibularhizoctonia sp. CBS 109695]